MVYSCLSDKASEFPDKTLVVHGQRRVSYGEIDHGVSKLAAFLIKKGIRIGDRIGILSENTPEYIVSCFGIQKAGGISVDVNFQYSPLEMANVLNDCQAEAIIVEERYLKALMRAIKQTPSIKTVVSVGELPASTMWNELPSSIDYVVFEDILDADPCNAMFPEISGKDIASIIYTSGTTRLPKGVMLSHDNFVANADSIIKYLHLTDRDIGMVVLPFCYSYGKSLLTTHVMAGGTIVLENTFMYPNVVLDKMVEDNVTGFAGVPSTFAILLNRSNIRKYSFPSLRYVTQAGGPMSPRYAKELAGVLPETQIYIMYGQTEATARLTYLEPEEIFLRPGSIGKPIPGVKVEVVKDDGTPAGIDEAGEIVAEGRNVMAGYWKNPEETGRVLREGKLHTGDIAKMDSDGYLYMVGRRSDMIKSGAHRISPNEIEEVVLELIEVHEVAVVGVDDEILGESIAAVIILKDGFQIDVKQVQIHCRKKLASFKIPRHIIFVNELPKTSSGKVRRHQLKDNLRAGTISI